MCSYNMLDDFFLSRFVWFCIPNLQLHNLNNSNQKFKPQNKICVSIFDCQLKIAYLFD